MEVRMIELQASVFDPVEARKRLGLPPTGSPGEESLERGRQDRRELIVATTMFKSTLVAGVPVHGAIELGISRQMLKQAIDEYERGGVPVLLKGEFGVNYIPCKGSLRVDFKRQEGIEFKYSAAT